MSHTIEHQRPSLWQRFTTAIRGIWTGPLTSSSPELARLWATSPVSSGVQVNLESALAVSTFYACASLLANSIASLPLLLYKRLPNGGKERFDTQALYWLLKDEPNAEQSSFEFRRDLVLHCVCTGNAYAEVQRNGAGRPSALWPITPDRVTILRGSGRVQYQVAQPQGGSVILEARDVFHLRNLSWNGILGLDTTHVARQALGLAIASETFSGKYFANGATVGGILATDLTEPSRKNLAEAIRAQHQGVDRSHSWLLTPQGSTFTPVGVDPQKSQMVEARAHQVVEICRFFGISPILIGDASRATWSNYAEARQQFFTQVITPWLTNIEQALTSRLISPLERRQQVIEHATEGFLRGNHAERGAFYAQMLNMGVYSINEVRELENRAPIAGGDAHLKPMNMEYIAALEPAPDVSPARAAVTLSAHRDLLLAELGRWTARECDRALRQQTPTKLRAWANAYRSDDVQRDSCEDKLRPAIRAWLATQGREAETDSVTKEVARHHMETTARTLVALCDQYSDHGSEDDFRRALQQQIDRWGHSAGRLHRAVDWLIQHGTPPPVETPAQLAESTRGLSLALATKKHDLVLASDSSLPKSDLQTKAALVRSWQRGA